MIFVFVNKTELNKAVSDQIITTDLRTLKNSAAGGIKVIEIGGKSEQNQYSGNNMFGGEVLADKIVSEFAGTKKTSAKTVVYESPSTQNKILLEDVFKENTPYTIILYGMNYGDYVDANIKVSYTDGTNSNALTFASKGELSYCIFKTNANKTVKAIRGFYGAVSTVLYYEKCGVFEGEVALEDFEPFVGNKPSPNTDYQQEIKKVVLTGAKSVNKNFFNAQTVVKGRLDNGVLGYESDTTDLTVNGDAITCTVINAYRGFVSDYIAVSGSVAVSCVSTVNYNFIDIFDKDKQFIRRVSFTTEKVLSVSDNEVYIRVSFQNTTTGTFTVSNIQVELGDKVTDYQRNQESSITFTNPITLREKDILTPKVIKRKRGVITLDGTENWLIYTIDGVNQFYVTEKLINGYTESSKAICISNYFVGSKLADRKGNYNIVYGIGGLGLAFNTMDFLTVDEWKNWLAQKYADGNPVIVEYEFADYVEEELPTADQIALNSLLSFDGVTHLYFDSEIEPTSLAECGTNHVGALTLLNSNLHEQLNIKRTNSREVLWTNSSPSLSIPSNTPLLYMTLEEYESYNFFMITYAESTESGAASKQLLMARAGGYGNGNNSRLEGIIKEADTYHYHERSLAYSYDSQAFMVGQCTYLGADCKANLANDKLIPYQIIGIKG